MRASSLIGSGAPADMAAQGLAVDGRSLDRLKHADAGNREAIREVARQFEALFMRQLLKSMRDAVPRSGMFEGPGSDVFEGMLDTQLSTMASKGNGGLASLIERQLLGDPTLPDGRAARTGSWTPAQGLPFSPGMLSPSAAFAVSSDEMRPPMPVNDPARERIFAVREADRPRADGLPALHGQTGQVPAAWPAGAQGDSRMAAEADGRARRKEDEGRPAPALGPVQSAFVERMWPHARAAEKHTGLRAAWIVGQAALESGWGQRDIHDVNGNPSHNLFGIKAGAGWKGKTVAAMTTEYEGGVARKTIEVFRRYDSYAEAFADWARLIRGNPRYAQVVRATNAEEFASALEQGGYATDPAYGRKLSMTIDRLQRSVGMSGN